jgi:hypothetical protein
MYREFFKKDLQLKGKRVGREGVRTICQEVNKSHAYKNGSC